MACIEPVGKGAGTQRPRTGQSSAIHPRSDVLHPLLGSDSTRTPQVDVSKTRFETHSVPWLRALPRLHSIHTTERRKLHVTQIIRWDVGRRTTLIVACPSSMPANLAQTTQSPGLLYRDHPLVRKRVACFFFLSTGAERKGKRTFPRPVQRPQSLPVICGSGFFRTKTH